MGRLSGIRYPANPAGRSAKVLEQFEFPCGVGRILAGNTLLNKNAGHMPWSGIVPEAKRSGEQNTSDTN
jgi:hypothetical protein